MTVRRYSPDHEAHGFCAECGYPVHCYPFGWQHVGTGAFSCPTMTPVASCCDTHRLPRGAASPS